MMWDVPVKYITLRDLVKLSPVPVCFKDDVGKTDVKDATRLASYFFDTNEFKHKVKPCPRIEILNSLSNSKKISSLIHEISHAICHKKNCECHNSADKSKAEIHAYEYTLKWLLKNKCKKILKLEIKDMEGLCGREDYYGEAVEYIMKTELWQKCLKYVGKL